MSKRLNLHLPDDHWVFDIPINERAKKVKEILDYARDIEPMAKDIAEIKKILLSGNTYVAPPPAPSESMEDADTDLIMSVLGM